MSLKTRETTCMGKGCGDCTVCELRAALAKVTAELAATRGQLAEARGLLERVVKYVVEDRATTPGVTRLARWTDKARAFLAQPATTPALVPASTVHADSKPPVTEEQSSCGGCGRRSAPWEGWQRPDKGACWWLWEPAFQMWTFLCRDEREDEATPALVTTPEAVPMVLHCPECRFRHVDVGDFATKVHHTHSCQNCGLTWRPAVVPTVGVQFLPGFKNAEPLGPTRGEQGEDLTSCGGCGREAVVWRHDRAPTPADPCCWIREPGMWAFDCAGDRVDAAPAAAGPLVAPTPGEWSVESHLGAHEDTVKVTPERLLASQPLVKPAPTPEPARRLCTGGCDTGECNNYCARARDHEGRHICQDHGGNWRDQPVDTAPTPEPARHDDVATAARIVANVMRFRRRLHAYRAICAEAGLPPEPDAEGRLLHEWTFVNVPDPADDETAPLAAAPAQPTEVRGPRAGDVFLDSLDGKEWTLLGHADGWLPGWRSEDSPGADNGFVSDGTFAIEGRLTYVRSAPATGEGAAPATTGEETKR